MARKKVKLSPRLKTIVDALPLYPGIRVLEIGCATGAAAREVASRIGNGHILAIDRSAKAIALAREKSHQAIASGQLSFREISVENFELEAGEFPYDLAFAVRVRALDGRHPAAGQLALPRIARALTKNGKLFIDGGDPLTEVPLDAFR